MSSLVYNIEVGTGIENGTIDGNRHREDGPAVEHYNGDRLWYIDGNRHREDGPAVEFADGHKEWYLDGVQYSNSDWRKELKHRNHQRMMVSDQ